jgi:hypothetical protein
MRCTYSSELLSGYLAGALSKAFSENVQRHLMECPACKDFCAALEENRSLLRSLRSETASELEIAAMHRGTMSKIEGLQSKLGWTQIGMKIERFLYLGLRRPGFAIAGLLILVALSVSLLAGIRQSGPVSSPEVRTAAVFEGSDILIRPEGYREWVFVGSSIGLNYAANPPATAPQDRQHFHNVYIDPVAYKHYERTKEFPEGTVMILEIASAELKAESGLQGSYEKDFVALEVSVKDSSRFKGGWAYFGFTDGAGKLKPKAQPFPETAGCLACHTEHAQTDHVFTQFYPVLRAARS